jgi:hypothetical protein
VEVEADELGRERARDPQELERLLVSRERVEMWTEWRPSMNLEPFSTAATGG